MKALYPLSSLLLDAYSVNFRYFGSQGNSSRHSTHYGDQKFEKAQLNIITFASPAIFTDHLIYYSNPFVKYQNLVEY